MKSRFTMMLTLIVLMNFEVISQEKATSPLPITWTKYRYSDVPPKDYYTSIMVITNRKVFENNGSYTYGHGINRSTPRTFFTAYFFKDSVLLVPQKSFFNAIDNILPDRDILVYINGHGKNIYQMLYRTWEVDQTYNINVILFDWPTDNIFLSSTILNAKTTAKNFSITMDELSKIEFEEQNMSIVFHSMGNHILKKYAGDQEKFQVHENHFNNLIISSPAVKHNRHAQWIEEIRFANRIYLTYNNNDRTLQGASILRFKKQLGIEPSQPFAQNAYYIDFTPYAGQHHTYFINRENLHGNKPGIYKFFNLVFHGEPVERDILNSGLSFKVP